MFDAFNLATLQFGLFSCLGSSCLLGIVALLGVAFMLTRRKGLGQSLKFSALIIVVPLACPAVFAAGFVTSFYRTYSFLESAVTATGTVVRLEEDSGGEGGVTYSAIVEFTTADGQVIQFDDSSRTCNPPCNQVGDVVPVIYSPETPQRASIQSVWLDWIWPAVFGLLFVVFLGLGVFLAWRSYRSGNWSHAAWEIVEAGLHMA
jgi:hypothetical protein